MPNLQYPKKVILRDLTVREGFQHEEKTISLRAKLRLVEQYLDLGADDIEHADHDGSAPPDKVYEYFSMVLDKIPDPKLHIAHFHVTRGWGLANVLAGLLWGIISVFLDLLPL